MMLSTRDELIAEVIRNLEAPPGGLAFTPPLEEHYRTTIALQRRRSLIFASLIGLAVLAAFTVQRAFFTDTSADPVAFGRWLQTMGAIAAVSLAVLVIDIRAHTHRVIDRITIVGVVVIAALVATSFRVEVGKAATIGVYCWVMVPLAAANLASLHFRQALAAILLSDAIYVAALFSMPTFDELLHGPALLLVSSVSAMTLWGNYRNDRDHRALFLFMTRERLLAEMSAEQNAALKEMTTLDPLTGIANRRAFEERFGELRAADPEAPLALAMIDIDHFKAFNDLYGHLEGDRCLTAVARALTASLRGHGDLVARLGGEEFVVLVAGATADDVPILLERLRRAVERLSIPHAAGESGVRSVVTVSIGCAVFAGGEAVPRREALERADRALYAAKRAGRNRWIVSDEARPRSGQPA